MTATEMEKIIGFKPTTESEWEYAWEVYDKVLDEARDMVESYEDHERED